MYKNDLKKILSALFTLILVLGVFSCNTDDEPQAGLTVDSSAALTAELTGDDYFSMVEELSMAAMQTNNTGARIAIGDDSGLDCANISFTGTLEHGELTVDFGSGGCADGDGKVRKGKIIILINGSWQQPGSAATISLADFSVDDVMIEGSWTVAAKGFTKESLSFETKLINGKVTWPGGISATREADRIYTFLFNLADLGNVSVSVEGTASGTTTKGLNYETVIADPLMYSSACVLGQSSRIPVQGVLEITSNKTGFTKVIVDFGQGDCDETFTVTVGPFTKEMTPDDLDSFI